MAKRSMANADVRNSGTSGQCIVCGLAAERMYEEDQRIYCQSCYRAHHRSGGGREYNPSPDHDIEQAARQ